MAIEVAAEVVPLDTLRDYLTDRDGKVHDVLVATVRENGKLLNLFTWCNSLDAARMYARGEAYNKQEAVAIHEKSASKYALEEPSSPGVVSRDGYYEVLQPDPAT